MTKTTGCHYHPEARTYTYTVAGVTLTHCPYCDRAVCKVCKKPDETGEAKTCCGKAIGIYAGKL